MGGVEGGGTEVGKEIPTAEGPEFASDVAYTVENGVVQSIAEGLVARAAFAEAYEGGDGGKGECGIDRLNAMMPDLEDGARLAHKLATLENQRGALLQMLEEQWEHDVRPNVGDFFAPDVSEALEEIGKRTRLASAEWQANRPCRPDRLSEG